MWWLLEKATLHGDPRHIPRTRSKPQCWTACQEGWSNYLQLESCSHYESLPSMKQCEFNNTEFFWYAHGKKAQVQWCWQHYWVWIGKAQGYISMISSWGKRKGEASSWTWNTQILGKPFRGSCIEILVQWRRMSKARYPDSSSLGHSHYCWSLSPSAIGYHQCIPTRAP